MELTRSEENKNRMISGGVTLLVMSLLLLFLILFQIITPNPPFPPSGGGGGIELGLGVMNAGTNDVDFGSMGQVTDVVADNTQPETKEKLATDDDGEPVPVNNEEQPVVKNEKTVIKPVKPKEPKKEKTMAELITEKAKKNKGKNGGGTGDSGIEGEIGKPGGDLTKNGEGGEGGGKGKGKGTGIGDFEGPGSGPGPAGIAFNAKLAGRAVIKKPKLPSDTKEEGKVVVEITVDSEGKVIEANPNGRGTTTSSALLKAKAKQAALDTRFDVNGKFEEQHGTITIVFSFD